MVAPLGSYAPLCEGAMVAPLGSYAPLCEGAMVAPLGSYAPLCEGGMVAPLGSYAPLCEGGIVAPFGSYAGAFPSGGMVAEFELKKESNSARSSGDKVAALGSFLGAALPEGGMVAALGSFLGAALPEGGMVAALGSFLGPAPVTNCGTCKFIVLSICLCWWEAPRVTSCSVSVDALCMGAIVSAPKSAAIFAKPSLSSGLIESSELEGMDTIDTSSVAALMLLLGARVWSSSGLPAILLSLIKQE